MNHSDKNSDSSAKQPSLRFATVPLSKMTLRLFRNVLETFKRGRTSPLILRLEDEKPVAALVPFDDYLRLVRYDQALEDQFQGEISVRGDQLSTGETQALSMDQLLEQLIHAQRLRLASAELIAAHGDLTLELVLEGLVVAHQAQVVVEGDQGGNGLLVLQAQDQRGGAAALERFEDVAEQAQGHLGQRHRGEAQGRLLRRRVGVLVGVVHESILER